MSSLRQRIIKAIANDLKVKESAVNQVVELLFDEECTIPFVARYRKERTGGLDEVVLREIKDRFEYNSDLEALRTKYMKLVSERCSSDPALKGQWRDLEVKFLAAESKQALEDLYLPFKPKRRTRAMAAKEKGLAPLAGELWAKRAESLDLLSVYEAFQAALGPEEAGKGLPIEECLSGAKDILAEQIAEDAQVRQNLRSLSMATGVIRSIAIEAKEGEAGEAAAKKLAKKAEQHEKFRDYFDFKEPANAIPGHRMMALRRGEAEGHLRIAIDVDESQAVNTIEKFCYEDQKPSSGLSIFFKETVGDAYKRLLAPSIETDLRLELKTRAEHEAIRVFAQNLENLLLLPPLPQKIVMGVDPGLRTGSKLAVVNQNGTLLEYKTIHPDLRKNDGPKTLEAVQSMKDMVVRHNVQVIAVGNGTGGREIFRLVAQLCRDLKDQDVKRVFVNEAGASVYSADAIAREEFPDLDPTIRSAISIARRLQDPLAELVKIDPRSIGVGQYQHDVNVAKLKSRLGEIVESCVNRVGVNLNSASFSLLSYVSGVGPTLARKIVALRDQRNGFKTRQELLEVPGFGPKVFQQSAGFLRIPDSENPLDRSAVHPERYDLVMEMAVKAKLSLEQLVGNPDAASALPLEEFVTGHVGLPTLLDIRSELEKPGRDPRHLAQLVEYSDDVNEITDLRQGMILEGCVTNVTNFGAFVDIGVHQDGLVHISELGQEFVTDATSVIAVGEIVKVRVTSVDVERKRIGLSRRLEEKVQTPPKREQDSKRAGFRNDSRPQARDQRPNGSQQQRQQKPASQPPRKQHSLDDLLEKFNTKGFG